MKFDAHKFLLWYASKRTKVSPETIARWQYEECLNANKDLLETLKTSMEQRTNLEINLRNAQSNLMQALEKISVLEKTCDKAVARVHQMERQTRSRKPLPPEESKLFNMLRSYAAELVCLHNLYDEGNAKRFGPAVEQLRRHLDKCEG